MNTTRIDTVIFDVGKVLVSFDWEGYLDSYGFHKVLYEAIANATFRSPLWDEHDTGKLSDEEYLQLFIQNAPAYEEEIRQVYARDGEAIHMYDYAVPWVRYLKDQGCRLYILSNYSHNTFVQTKDRMEFLPYMDGALFSYTVQQRKPYPCIYNTLMKKYQIDPASAVFIDDRAENIRTARELGMKGILFTNYEQAAGELRKIGL